MLSILRTGLKLTLKVVAKVDNNTISTKFFQGFFSCQDIFMPPRRLKMFYL